MAKKHGKRKAHPKGKVSSKRSKRRKKISRGFAKNNYNYIRSLLWKKNRGDFKHFKDTAFVASLVFNACKFSDCSDDDIQGYYLEEKQRLNVKPKLPPKLHDPFPYYDEGDVTSAILPNYLWIVSDLLPSPHEILSRNYNYEDTFKPFVDWCNQMKEQGMFNSSDDAPQMVFGEVYWNAERNRWEVEVFSVDVSGRPHDFGFQPTGDIGGYNDPESDGPDVPIGGGPPIKPPVTPEQAAN
jgi:hypothetical protein